MANSEHVARALEGKESWNTWSVGELEGGRLLKLDFSGSTFETANFKGFLFTAATDFSNCEFSCSADFHGAIFHSSANFYKAHFVTNAGFASCHFLGEASFTKAHVDGDAWFTHAVFSGQAWFENVMFRNDFEATDAVFESSARFAGAEFSGRACFHDATFAHGAWFNATTFWKDARFTRTKFDGGAEEFSDASFVMAPDFRASRFQVPPTFQRSVIGYATNVASSRWRRILDCAVDNSQAPSYRRLKQFASEAKDHERELQFFALEMRAKRFYETKDFWPITLNVAYDWLSDYGRSVARPMMWLVALITIAMGVVLHGHLTVITMTSLEAAGIVAFTNTALLLGADRWLLRVRAIDLCAVAVRVD